MGCGVGLSAPADRLWHSGRDGWDDRAHFHQAPGTRHQVLLPQHYPGFRVPVLCEGIEHIHEICSSSFSAALMIPPCELGEEDQHTQTQIRTNNPTIRPGRTKGAQAPCSRRWPDSSSGTVPAPAGRQCQKEVSINLHCYHGNFPQQLLPQGNNRVL